MTASTILKGDGARIPQLNDHSADLVFTSPPYFPERLRNDLTRPKAEQTQIDAVEGETTAFAYSTLRPVLAEMHRILKPGRALVVQTKDLEYGDVMIPLVSVHLQTALQAGFYLVTRVLWLPSYSGVKRSPRVLRSGRVGAFRARNPEVFLVLTAGPELEKRGQIDGLSGSLGELVEPLWRLPYARRRSDHPYATPRPVAQRLLALFSEPDDLVVDPFVGYGTILEVAHQMDRRVFGMDVDDRCVSEARARTGSVV